VLLGEAGGIHSAVALFFALIALACGLALPAAASATSYEVNSVGDQTDALLGDEVCETAAAKCTLRAAIQEANKSVGEGDAVGFDEALFDGQIAGTIALGTSLPTIVDRISIEGECVIGSSAVRPCVGVDGPGLAEAALTVENINEVLIDGLAITGAKTGIEVIGSPEFRAFADWLGVKLDGSPGGNGTGIYVGPGSDSARIGNAAFPDVFANNSGDGLNLHGASAARVQGNYFGVRPDGIVAAANGGSAIEVTSQAGGFEAARNAIGTELSPEALATPACDGGCNVISGSGASGIDLVGDPAPPHEDAPAAATTIVGNYIGLDASGAAALPNAAAGVRVGSAARTAIGGPRAKEANRFAGGEAAVAAGPGAANFAVRGNSIGLGGTGAPLVSPDAGIVVDSEGVAAAAEAVIAGNEIGMAGGVAIAQKGLGAWIFGNSIAGADTGIRAGGETEEHGNLIQGNLIEGSGENGVLVESSFNELLGNAVLGSGGAGILVEGAPFAFGVSGNLIGGDSEAEENLVTGSGGAAIEISNLKNTNNEVARNWGFANDGLFIDLVAASPSTEPQGPNKGIKPPLFAFATRSGAGGFDAEPGARIRVFRKASADAGEVESFLAEAFADEEGAWEVFYGAIPAGAVVAATQTAAGSGTSELAVARVPDEAGGEAQRCATDCGAAAPTPLPPIPQTKIFKGPEGKKLAKAVAAFRFSSSVAGSTFQCKLDGRAFKACHSPKLYTGLKPGKHLFKVRALNSAGQADPTPAKLKFTVLG
jgi:CSLREA domain-containing protein